MAIVYFGYYLEYPRQPLTHKLHRPAFERLGHYGMIGVGYGLFGQVPCIVPAVSAFVKQYPHKLGNGKHRMGVVYMNGYFFVETLKRAELGKMTANNILQRGRNKKILLCKAQKLTFCVNLSDLPSG